jgi:hypothetical protein
MSVSGDDDADMDGEGGCPGRIERAIDRLRRVLQYQVSIGALIEVALWLALPYLSVGFVWALFHAEQTARIQTRLESVLPAGADVAAFGLTVALWPASIQIADACPPR